MLYLKSNQSNEIVVTWTERMTSFNWGTSTPTQLWGTATEQSWGLPIYIVLELRSIATNDVLTYPILKSSNISLYPERYDKYVLSIPDTTTGQYTYIAYESTTTSATNKISILETGLAYIQMGEQAFVSATNTITYAEPSTGTFDNTFDFTFN